MSLSNMLKGIGGEFEINRVVGAFGATCYVICANGFVGYEVFYLSKGFDLTAYCLAFPGGLAVAVGAIAGAVAIKDRNVAASQVIAATGSKPATPPAPAPEPKPGLDEAESREDAGLPESIR